MNKLLAEIRSIDFPWTMANHDKLIISGAADRLRQAGHRSTHFQLDIIWLTDHVIKTVIGIFPSFFFFTLTDH